MSFSTASETASPTAADALGDFLRSRRAAVAPAERGIVSANHRRVPGLRREELADLAGVSLTYYTRLEQGSATNPSSQVLDALARALGLDEVERAHLYRLAGATAPAPARTGLRRDILGLLDAMPDVAGIALSPVQDIIGWNRLGHAVLAPHLHPDAPYRVSTDCQDAPCPTAPRPNKVRMLFTDPAMRSLHREWEYEACLAVASLRYVTAPVHARADLARLVGELSIASPEFARLWAAHPVVACASGVKKFHHPVVGPLDLHYEMLHLPEEDGHRLLLMHAIPGTTDDDALRLLAASSVTEPHPATD